MDDGHCFREQALGLCARTGAEESDYRATSLSALVQMVASGSAVTLLPTLALELENRRHSLHVRAFTPKAPGRTIALVWRKNSALERALAAVGETLRVAYTVRARQK